MQSMRKAFLGWRASDVRWVNFSKDEKWSLEMFFVMILRITNLLYHETEIDGYVLAFK